MPNLRKCADWTFSTVSTEQATDEGGLLLNSYLPTKPRFAHWTYYRYHPSGPSRQRTS